MVSRIEFCTSIIRYILFLANGQTVEDDGPGRSGRRQAGTPEPALGADFQNLRPVPRCRREADDPPPAYLGVCDSRWSGQCTDAHLTEWTTFMYLDEHVGIGTA